MKVDDAVEDKVREAFAAAVGGERDRFDSAVEAIARAGDEFGSRALNLSLAVDSAALYSVHGGQWPDSEQIALLAGEFGEAEDWSGVEAQTVERLLTSLARVRSPLEDLTVGELIFAVFAVGGWLLSAFPLPEGTHWNDFLDQILEGLEVAPE